MLASYLLKIFWPMTPCQECHEKVEFLIAEEAVSSRFDKFTSASTAHEGTTLVLYKHNVVAKHRSSKLLTTNELWLLELQIESACILASIPNALWDVCKLSIEVHTAIAEDLQRIFHRGARLLNEFSS